VQLIVPDGGGAVFVVRAVGVEVTSTVGGGGGVDGEDGVPPFGRRRRLIVDDRMW
jgi:hypothetical protein